MVGATSRGSISLPALTIPASAPPGSARIVAVGRRSGTNPFENVLSPSTVANLGTKWSTLTGSAVYSSPAVVNGVVYVGSIDRKVYAFDLPAGRNPNG